MCGLVAIVNFSRRLGEEDVALARPMLHALSTRGPDGEGVLLRPHAVLGHKRLAVVDLNYGSQPMAAANADIALIFNGEIYNQAEIRDILVKHGYALKSRNSDTEVLLYAYDLWGERCVDHLNGDFAFVVWDGRSGSVFAARDRLGVKPLYYALTGGGIVFASELKAILKFPGISRRINPFSLIEIFSYNQPLPPYTLVDGIENLEAGHWLRVTPHGVEKHRYWDLPVHLRSNAGEDVIEQVAALVDRAVNDRLLSDVGVCALLSGGLDSSVICAAATKDGSRELPTYSVGFDASDNQTDWTDGQDTHFAQLVARHLNIEHIETKAGAGQVTELANSVACIRDLPCVMSQEIAMYLLFQRISGRQTVVLSGEGADELSCGYYFFGPEDGSADYNPITIKMGIAEEYREHMFHSALRKRARPTEYLAAKGKEIWAAVPSFSEDSKEDRLKKAQYCQVKYFLPYLLDRADRLSMACSLEVRVPFCDHRVAEYLFSLPAALLTKGGVEKYPLREAYRRRLPAAVIGRKKAIFPYLATASLNAKLYEQVVSCLRPPESCLSRILTPRFFSLWYEAAKADPHVAKGFLAGALGALTLESLVSSLSLELDF